METLELTIQSMAHGGSGIARVDGRVVFCPGVIPGEVVLAEVTDSSKKSMWRAQAISILEPSPHRIEHVWPEASIDRPWAKRAGGADYGHIELSHQRALKTDILRDSLARFGKFESPLIDQVTVAGVPGDDERGGTGWRTRVTLHADDTGRLGAFAERSHTVIPVQTLPLATPAIQDSSVLSLSAEGLHTVRAIDSTGSGMRLIVDQQAPQEITEIVGEAEFRLSDHSFWQVHHQAPRVLTEAVGRAVQAEYLDPHARHMDLYSGVGLLARALAGVADSRLAITAVESDESAVAYARSNLESVADVTAEAASVDRWIRGQVGKAAPGAWTGSTVILDPPRSGAKAEVIDALAALGVAQIVYVACDPVALGRDAGLLVGHGYEMVHLEAWDLFPHTHHMESIATFIRRTPAP